MNNLVKIREKIQKAERLHQARLLATKNGEVTPYRISVFKKRQQKALKDLENN
tara:strand:- start:1923 stop:2081 length:159 start_codon:yes stop_codon:yes gene_type:complete